MGSAPDNHDISIAASPRINVVQRAAGATDTKKNK